MAVEPETRNANTRTAGTGTDKYGMIRVITESANGEETSGAANGKRKYRARGERTRKEQQRAASRNYRLRHLEYYREYGLKYRAERKR